jgi:hypothetical protein
MMKAVKISGFAFKFASFELKLDEKLVTEAVK